MFTPRRGMVAILSKVSRMISNLGVSPYMLYLIGQLRYFPESAVQAFPYE
jgi:hypothetical protein